MSQLYSPCRSSGTSILVDVSREFVFPAPTQPLLLHIIKQRTVKKSRESPSLFSQFTQLQEQLTLTLREREIIIITISIKKRFIPATVYARI
jgi:hypothetical protein